MWTKYMPDDSFVLLAKVKYFDARSQQFLVEIFWLGQSSNAVTATIPVASSSISVVIVIVELPTLIN